MKSKNLLIATILLALPILAKPQNTDDYRTISSGQWSNPAIWEVYNGSAWVSTMTTPWQASNNITIRSGHDVEISGFGTFSIDQLTVESGATVLQKMQMNIPAGQSVGITVKGKWTMEDNTIIWGRGPLKIEGTLEMKISQLGGYNDSGNVEILSGGTLDMIGNGGKTFQSGTFTNRGKIIWRSGILNIGGISARPCRIVNHGLFEIYGNSGGNTGFMSIDVNGSLVNEQGGEIRKINAGNRGVNRIWNYGLIHVQRDTLENFDGSFIYNKGTIRLDNNCTWLNRRDFQMDTGALITGEGLFINQGTSLWMRGPAIIDSSAKWLNRSALFGKAKLTIHGNFQWESGAIGNTTDSANIEISSVGKLSHFGPDQKSLSASTIVNKGVFTWISGTLSIGGMAGKNGRIINHSLFEIYGNSGGNTGFMSIDVYGFLINEPGGEIRKINPGNRGVNRIWNYGLIHVQRDSLENFDGSFIYNKGTIRLDRNCTWLNRRDFQMDTGALITGEGLFVNQGSSMWVRGPATLDTPTNWINHSVITGKAKFTINGHFRWENGTIGNLTDSANFEISPIGVAVLASNNTKSVNGCVITNRGKMSWVSGNLSMGGMAGKNARISNYGVMEIFGNSSGISGFMSLDVFSSLVNEPGGEIRKINPGNRGVNRIFNYGLIHVQQDSLENFDGSFIYNKGTMRLDSNCTWLNRRDFHMDTGALVTGKGRFINQGTSLWMRGPAVFDTAITLICRSALTGKSQLTLHGLMQWESGEIGNLNDSANILVENSGRVLMTTTNSKTINGGTILNRGVVDWDQGDFYMGGTSTNRGKLINERQFNINVSTNFITGAHAGEIINRSTGIISKTKTGGTFINLNTLNNGIIEGIGRYSFAHSLINQGIISPGLSSIDSLGLDGLNPFGAQSTLLVEMQNADGPGIGHDLMTRNVNLTLAGRLDVIELSPVPNGIYTIIRTSTGQITGDFDTTILPAGYRHIITPDSVYLMKDFTIFTNVSEAICANSVFDFNGRKLNTAGQYVDTFTSVNGFDSVVTLNLSIHPAVETGVTVAGNVLSANAVNAAFRWLDCNNSWTPISGEVANVFTATQNGRFAVEVKSNQTQCIDTSACYEVTGVSLGKISLLEKIKIYPNPAEDVVYIQSNVSVIDLKLMITDVSGKELMSTIITRDITKLPLGHLKQGVYLLKFQSEDEQQTIKLFRR